MNTKAIEKHLRNKHEDFLTSITDDEVRNLVRQNSIITGGSIASLLLGEEVSDYDYYFTDLKTVRQVAEYYVYQFNNSTASKSLKMGKPEVREKDGRVRIFIKSAGVVSEETDSARYEYFESRPDEEGDAWLSESMAVVIGEADKIDAKKLEKENKSRKRYRPIFLTDNAITLANKIQLVVRFYGTPEEIHKNFDFVHCTNYWTSSDGKLTLSPAAMESILGRELRYVGSMYPVSTIIRMRKFFRKGWWMNAGQILKAILQVSQLDLTDPRVLEDQLTGVDTYYFYDLVARLKEEQAKDGKIDHAYVTTLIDKMF